MHLVSIHWVIVLIIWAVIGAWAVLFIMVCLLEKTHLDDFVPAPGGEPLPDTPYFTAMNDAAKRSDFTAAGIFVQSRSSRIYQAQTALWVSPEKDILLQICGGKTARVPIKRTVLWSVVSSNQIIQTQDQATAVDLSGLTDQRLLLRADLDELVSLHRQRLASYQEQVRTFSPGTAFSEWQSIRFMRVEQMARMGLARFLNQQQTIYRYTFKGAWLQYHKGLRGQLAEAKTQVDRMSKKAPGSA